MLDGRADLLLVVYPADVVRPIASARYFKNYSKARKRDREVNETERKLYLQDPLLELRIPENEINFLTDLPGGLDYNEWLASHSE